MSYTAMGAPPVLHAVHRPLTAQDWAGISAYARAVKKAQARGVWGQSAAAGLGLFPTLDTAKPYAMGLGVGLVAGYVLFRRKRR